MINLLVEVNISVICVVLRSKQIRLDLDYPFLPIDTISILVKLNVCPFIPSCIMDVKFDQLNPLPS